ncbi:MAG: short-chain dehydrogenase [Gammaproteobacteria bacterium TMED159]|nr:MAG: short-chain dehydrogenase [Gammaproteobacteria bacterium TMED159]
MEILNKRVVVTGAASGIGKALAVEFKNEQAKDVVLADLNEDVLKVAEELGYAGFVLNVSKEDEIQKLIAFANEKMNGIDIFCSNAGIGGAFGLLDVTTEDWQNIWDVNFMAHAHVAKHLIPQMLEQGSGYLVNTASAAGLLTQLGAAPYSVTKAAAVSLAEWIKITYGEKGIGVSCLCPQAVKTAMTAQGPGVAGVDGMIEADECAKDVIDAIKKERFLVTPHQEVLEYIKRKTSDYDRWILGMQRLQGRFEEFYEDFKDQ